MEFFKKIFKRKREKKLPPHQGRDGVGLPLRIKGVKTTLTPVPDDAELAAQALLESIAPQPPKGGETCGQKRLLQGVGGARGLGADYYRALSEKIKAAHEQERRAAMRYVAYVEQELKNPSSDAAHFAELERGLYKFQDAVEREKGGALGEHSKTLATERTQELLKRWQHCLAECIVRQMNAPIEREESDARIDSPEREEGQTKFNAATTEETETDDTD